MASLSVIGRPLYLRNVTTKADSQSLEEQQNVEVKGAYQRVSMGLTVSRATSKNVDH